MKVCSICNSKELAFKRYSKSYNKLFDNLQIFKCQECSYQFINSVFDRNSLKNFYKLNHYADENSNKNKIFFENIAKSRFDFIKSNIAFKKNYSILEVGAGDGFLLKEFISAKHSVNLTAIEYNKESIKKLKEQNIQVLSDLSKIKKKDKFDLIILSHVLEHVIDPSTFVDKLKSLLNKNGYIFVDVPCLDYLIKKETSSHISFFDLSSLNYLFKKLKLKKISSNYCGPVFLILRITKSLKFYLIMMSMIYFFKAFFVISKPCRLPFIWSLNNYSTYKRMWIRAIYKKS